MDINKILDYCKREYPPGTVYVSVGDNDKVRYTVRRTSFSIADESTIYAESGKGVLYCNGKYAKIINKNFKDKKIKSHELWI